ncbi:MAPK kinase substrate protein At1g80180-like [Lolium perenne]|uniref:MAPK kinase substrate protein At1g80180-like n=1 Tax=Lolium perenne TaxID=4522 RepID=UPI0021F53497|nr:MAPK kinase substrate protein At1g80180-like [Lolium perenne]
MAELQRSSQTFRRSGSSGLIWEERFMAEDQNQKDQGATGETDVSSLEPKELRHSRSVGSTGAVQHRGRDRSERGGMSSSVNNQAFRTRHVPPALDPPSPKFPSCMFCGIFRKEEPSQPSKPRRY